MDPTRKASREQNEITLQYQRPQEILLGEEFSAEKLAQLEEAVRQLEQTPAGAAELQQRIKLFGTCQKLESESAGQFYARLRHWLDRPILRTKSPLHPPRQTSD